MFLNNTEGVNGDTRYWRKILFVLCNYLCSFKYCLKLQMKRGLQQIKKSTNKVSNFISLTAECSWDNVHQYCWFNVVLLNIYESLKMREQQRKQQMA